MSVEGLHCSIKQQIKMKCFSIIGIWIVYVVLDWICLSVIRNHKVADNELAFAFTYIEVPLSLVVCLIVLLISNNVIESNRTKIMLLVLLFILLQIFNLYCFPAKK